MLLPELLFESCLFSLSGAELVKRAVLHSAEINRPQTNETQDKNYKNVSKNSHAINAQEVLISFRPRVSPGRQERIDLTE